MITHFEVRCCSSEEEQEALFSLVVLERQALRSARRHPKGENLPGWGFSMVVCWVEEEEGAALWRRG